MNWGKTEGMGKVRRAVRRAEEREGAPDLGLRANERCHGGFLISLAGIASRGCTLAGEAWQPLPVLSKVLGDTSTHPGAGQMETVFTARLCTGDGGPHFATNEAVLEGAEQCHQEQGLCGWPRTCGHGSGQRMQALELAGRAGIASLGPG